VLRQIRGQRPCKGVTRMKRTMLALLSTVAMMGCGGELDVSDGTRQEAAADTTPSGKGTLRGAVQRGSSIVNYAGTGITYHNGPVMLGTVNIYLIWYGNWASNATTTIIPDFVTNLSGSPYFNINSTYYSGSTTKSYVSGKIALAGRRTDAYSKGTALSDANIKAIVTSHIGTGKFPLDTNGIYFVLTSSDVNETSGFCTQYCGWHNHGTISSKDVKYSFVGDPTRCPSSCQDQTPGPNGSSGADGMASILAHEAEEAITDPDLNAWYNSTGENADLCAWTFGTTYTSGGATANMKLGTRDYLIQQNWLNSGSGKCVLQYP
jgi:hypothetical protein